MASYICEDCGKSFATNSKFNFHRKYHVKSDKEEECKFCRKKFNNTIKLSQHQSKCERFWCEYCSETFTKGALNRHTETVHGKAFLKCNVCDFVTARKDRLKKHIAVCLVKGLNKRYDCEQCNSSFDSAAFLNNHKRIHESKKPCKFCLIECLGNSFHILKSWDK